MLNQNQIPILEQLHRCATRTPHAPFYAPGHKRGQGISQYLTALLGESVFTADLPELPELDNLYQPDGVIQQAQTLASVAFGAEQTWFLVNGSTVGIIAAILATCNPGDKILIPRNIHSSVISGLVLSGAEAVVINPDYNPQWNISYSITPQAIEQALKQYCDIKAILIVYPTYEGICGDITAIADLAHQYHIPLIVDEAHGPHFAFHPDLPLSALAAGADIAIQSTHKVLGAMTQASMLHVQGSRVNRDRITQALQQLQSSSPSYLLLASLDAARHQMVTQGKKLMSDTLTLARLARSQLQQIPNLSVFHSQLDQYQNQKQTQKTAGFIDLDLTRLTVNVSPLGLSGYQADEILHQQLGITAELPSLKCLTFIISLGNTETEINQLIAGLTTISQDAQTVLSKMHQEEVDLTSAGNLSVIRPRMAFFAPVKVRSLNESIGYISAELVCPYPPGIPVLIPGETITIEQVQFLQAVLKLGATLTGCSDPTLETVNVVS